MAGQLSTGRLQNVIRQTLGKDIYCFQAYVISETSDRVGFPTSLQVRLKENGFVRSATSR